MSSKTLAACGAPALAGYAPFGPPIAGKVGCSHQCAQPPQTAQLKLLRDAWNRGELDVALAHAACSLEVWKHPAAFEPDRSVIHMFPLYAGIFVNERTRWAVKDDTRLRALAHARVAVAWERLGHADSSEREIREALTLTGSRNAIALKRAALVSMEPMRSTPTTTNQ